MSPLKPYLIRSLYEWIVDNQLTPYIEVSANSSTAVLPEEYIENGKIVLNIKPQSIDGLVLGNDEIQFQAGFSGIQRQIVFPTDSVLGIFSKENGQGMFFNHEENTDENPDPPEKKHTKPQLRVVK